MEPPEYPTGDGWQTRPRWTRAGTVVGGVIVILAALALFYIVDPGAFDIFR